MRKRTYNKAFHEPPCKPAPSTSSTNAAAMAIKPGLILTDLKGKQWRLGKCIGYGGFGVIYLGSNEIDAHVTNNNANYVIKLEEHANGPLFVEVNCLMRIGKLEIINYWKHLHNKGHLGMPHFIATGSHTTGSSKFRFLVLPRYKADLQQMMSKKGPLNLKTALTVAMQIIDVLEYVHEQGYIHADIKASNIVLGEGRIAGRPVRQCREKSGRIQRIKSLRKISQIQSVQNVPDLVHLIDFGLSSRYLSKAGEHKPYFGDERKAHAGTLPYCSVDAHYGVQSRRSDLQSLGFNIIDWLGGVLPWNDQSDAVDVQQTKEESLRDVNAFLRSCSGSGCPAFLYEYFDYVQSLAFQSRPDYARCKQLFASALKHYGYEPSDLRLDMEKRNGHEEPLVFAAPASDSGAKLKPLGCNANRRNRRAGKRQGSSPGAKRARSRAGTNDIHVPLERKCHQNQDYLVNEANSVLHCDMAELNPTPAMAEIIQRIRERNCNSNGSSPKYGKGEVCPLVENTNGLTPAMIQVLMKKKGRDEKEFQKMIAKNAAKAKKLKIGDKRKSATAQKTKFKKRRTSQNMVVKTRMKLRSRLN